ncbi:MAG: hypothetical protein B7Z66_09320 [Chromatiales bacterium 21-64-14]|nr:MAG: hypothetical protein B7Z66_09320 [Chromatiales bacterium 21-64-14]HQU16193.1 plastocyanin/azurin family copper-binding protein [Gammaproteobacteria bacterium]
MKKFGSALLVSMAAAAFILPGASQAEDMASMAGMHMEKGSQAEAFPFGHPGSAKHVDRVIRITAMDFKFVPKTITVKAGQTIKFVVVNKGMVKHEFVLGTNEEQKEHEKEMEAHPNMKMDDPNGIAIQKGKTASLIWTFTKPMTVRYACHEPGHYAAGMYGELRIE